MCPRLCGSSDKNELFCCVVSSSQLRLKLSPEAITETCNGLNALMVAAKVTLQSLIGLGGRLKISLRLNSKADEAHVQRMTNRSGY